MDQLVPITFPIQGVNRNWSAGRQPDLTCRDALNVRALDPVTGRTRGAQRAGLTDEYGEAVAMENAKIQDLTTITYNRKVLTYFQAGLTEQISTEWSTLPVTTGPNTNQVMNGLFDRFGNLYVARARDGFAKYSQEGGLITSVTLPIALNSVLPASPASQQPMITAIAVDELESVYLGISPGIPLSTGGASMIKTSQVSRIWKYRKTDTGEYELAWEYKPPSGAPNRYAFVMDMHIVGGRLYTAEVGALDSWVRRYDQIHGQTAPFSEDYEQQVPNWPRSVAARDGSIYVTLHNGDAGTATRQIDLHKYDEGEPGAAGPVWSMNDLGGSYAPTYGGVGIGVRVGAVKAVYSHGPFSAQSAGEPAKSVRKIIDNGTSFELVWSGPLASGIPDNSEVRRSMRIAIDHRETVYVPFDTLVSTFAIDTEGSLLLQIRDELFNTAPHAPRCAIPLPAEYDSQQTDVSLTEFLYVGTEPGTVNMDTLHAYQLLMVSQDVQEIPRQTRLVAVSEGNIRVGVVGSGWKVVDPLGLITGEQCLDRDAPTVFSVTHFNRQYFADGLGYAIYDPRDLESGGASEYGAVSKWAAEAGSLPKRCRLIQVYRGRIVLSGDPEDPQNWYMSAVEGALDWDYNPPVPRSTDAVAGNNAPAGLCPDIVNGIVPVADDFCLFGGDKSLWRLTGDPQINGQFDLLSDQTGMAFGRAWCKDPDGHVYFYGSRHGIYATNGVQSQKLSRHAIDQLLEEEVDLLNYFVRMEWNDEDEGIHVIQSPYRPSHQRQVKAFFFDVKTGGFWPVSFRVNAEDAGQPTAIAVRDPDVATRRAILLGFGDGRVYTWDPTAVTDGGSAIDSYVDIGPLNPPGNPSDLRWNQLQVTLAEGQGGAMLELYGSPTADGFPDTPRHRVTLRAGRNGVIRRPMRASYAWVRLRSSSADRWAFESGTLRASRMGRGWRGHGA